MAQRSSVALLAVSGLALVVVAGGAGGVVGYSRLAKGRANAEPVVKPGGGADTGPARRQRFEALLAFFEPDKPADTGDKFAGFKAILPDVQKGLAGGEWKHVRVDDVKVTVAADSMSVEFRGVWLYEGAPPTDEKKRALHAYLKGRSKELLKGQVKDPAIAKLVDDLGYEERGIDPLKSPAVALRDEAVRRPELAGAVFGDAWYGDDGRLRLAGYDAKDREAEQKKLVDELLRNKEVVPPEVLGTKGGKPIEPSLADLKPVDYAALKKRAQEEFAGTETPLLQRTRVDGVGFQYVKDDKGPALVLRWRGQCLLEPGEEKKADEVRTQIKDALKKGPETTLPQPLPEKYDSDVRDFAFRDNPVLALQEKVAADPRLDGVLFEAARFDKEGKLEIQYLTGDEQKPLVEALLKGVGGEVVPRPHAIEWPQKGGSWAAMLKGVQAKLAADTNDDLATATRLDRAYFAYEGSLSNPRLYFKGVCIKKGERDDLRKKLQEKLAQLVKTEYPALARTASVSADRIDFRDLLAKSLQEAVKKDPTLDGVLILSVRYDASGALDPQGFIPKKGTEARKRLDALLEEELKGTGLFTPSSEKPPEKPKEERKDKEDGPALEEAAADAVDDGVVANWQRYLKELRKQFGEDRKNPVFRQTRLDRAYFEYVGDEPRIHFEFITLQPHGEPAELRTRLEQRLESYYADKVKRPGGQAFKVVLPANPFQVDPTPGLQRLVATDPTLDGVLFESAWFDEDRHLNFDVIYDDTAGQADKIKKVFADNEIARRYVKPALVDNTEPKLNPRTFIHWEEQRRALQGTLAAGPGPLSQRTRVDRVYFTYEGNDTANRQLKVEGVSLQPGAAVDNQKELAKTVQARYEPRLPGVEFKTVADGVSFVASPVIGLQAMVVDRRLDDTLFGDAVYDGDGRLHLRVYQGGGNTAPQVRDLVATPAAREALKPALGKKTGQTEETMDAPRPFPWREDGAAATGLADRLQKRFAASDVRAARQTRVDRAYFLYDKQLVRQMHLEGVSLWDGVPKATLPETLTPVCREVLPEPAYQLVTDRVSRKPNPAPGLQQKVAGKPEFDGILFEDAGFDDKGHMVFPVLTADSEPQKAEVRRLVDAAPLAEGTLPADEERRKLGMALHTFDWEGMVKGARAWAAGPTAPPDARKTRLDRAYFTREDGGCQLQLVGATLLVAPEGDPAALVAARNRVADVMGKRCLEQLRPLKLRLPEEPKPLARGVTPTRRDLRTVLRGVIPTRRTLDGVNVTDVVYDEAGKVALEGHWVSPDQGRELGDILTDALQPEPRTISRFGTSLDRLRVVRTDLLLRDLRKWLVDKTEVEEVLFDRLYFDAAGKMRIDGFFTRPDDQGPAEKAGLDGILAYPIGRSLLGLDPDGIVRPPLEGKDIIHLTKRASLVQYLRSQVPNDTTLDGIRIDRCTYDPDAAFVLNGLEDAPGQSRGLTPLLEQAQQGPAFRDHLAGGWRLGTFRTVPMRKMLRALSRAMPSDPTFDGVTLDRAYHDAANHLVLTGAVALFDFPGQDERRKKVLNERRQERAKKALAALIDADPDWRLRVSYGGPDVVFKPVAADPELGERAFERAVEWYAHQRKADRAIVDLNTTLFNVPGDATAWYFRAVVELAVGDEAAARRDLRRVLGFANGRPPLVEQVIDYGRLELVQGRNRATATQRGDKMGLAPPADKPIQELLKELSAEPGKAPPPDEAPGWDTRFCPLTPPCVPRCGAPCWLPR
jgi:hypothetical protein